MLANQCQGWNQSDDDSIIHLSNEEDELLPRSPLRPINSLHTALQKLYPYYLSIEEDDLPKLHSFLGKTGFVMQEIYRAALKENDASLDRPSIAGDVKKRKRRSKLHKSKKRHHKALVCNGGGMDHHDSIASLLDKYGIERTSKHSSVFTSTTTTFQQALQTANAHARFLICYISTSSKNNALVIPTLLDPQFLRVCNRKPLGKKNREDTGSYYVWICNDKSEGEVAIKMLKLKKSDSILTILHPATVLDSSNRPKVTANNDATSLQSPSSSIFLDYHCVASGLTMLLLVEPSLILQHCQ